MGFAKSMAGQVAGKVAPQMAHAAPGVASRAVLEALDKAINGVGPLTPAAAAADKQLAKHDGDVPKAIRAVIEINLRLSSAQGFITNLGGLTTAAVALPANVIGLAVLQSRMIAGIAHLSGHDVNDPRVRNAVLAAMLGDDGVSQLVRKRTLPGSPVTLTTAATPDFGLRTALATEVAAHLIARVAGKRLVLVAGRRIPVVGGVIGASADGFSTWRIGRYAESEFARPRKRR